MHDDARAWPSGHQTLDVAKEELGVCDILCALRVAPVPAPPVLDRRPPAASSHSSRGGSSSSSSDEGAEQQPRRLCRKRGSSSSGPGDEEAETPTQRATRKARTLSGGSGDGNLQLQRRSYTWRGLCSRRAEKQQQQQAAEAAAAAAAVPSSAPSSGSTASASGVSGGGGGGKEGDREFAALTTWLRMNVHRPRTAKKAVLFLGARDAVTERWTFQLNPLLSWADVSPDTRFRLQHLPAEAAQAFAAKYPGRPPQEWRLKSQRYRPPGSSATHQVCLEDLVTSLHAVWAAHEGPVSAATSAAAAVELASCGTSTRAAPAPA